jgi:hypothetical protein
MRRCSVNKDSILGDVTPCSWVDANHVFLLKQNYLPERRRIST